MNGGAALTGPGGQTLKGFLSPTASWGTFLVGTYLFRRKNRNVVFIYYSCFLFNHGFISFFLQFLTRHPEEHVLLAELRSEKLPESVASRGREHELVEGLSPGAGLLQGGGRAGRGGRKGRREQSYWWLV